MCGIAGIIHAEAGSYIRPMTEILSHRGPDGEGYYTENKVALGHRRLSIQDLSLQASQPMCTENGRFILVYNGEIYNHQDIRVKLDSNHEFTSHGDTETLLYALAEERIETLNRLNGMFAFCLLDKERRELFLARDPFGMKPLYWYSDAHTFAFASEIKAFEVLPFFDKEPDISGITNYMQYLWSPGSKTAYAHVKKLEPGHYMTVSLDDRSVRQYPYFNLDIHQPKHHYFSEKEWVEQLNNELSDAVRRHLLSDVPVAFFLSGGLDSSAVVAVAKKCMPEQHIVCYTIDPGAASMDDEGFGGDLYYARRVAEHLGVELREVKADTSDFDKLKNAVLQLDEPLADLAPLYVQAICRQAQNDGFKVLLGGTGGDDVFTGYRRHQVTRFEWMYNIIPHIVFKLLEKLIAFSDQGNPVIRRINKLISAGLVSRDDRLLHFFRWISNSQIKDLIHTSCKLHLSNTIDPLENTLNAYSKGASMLEKVQMLDMKYFLPDHNLTYTDKMSMAESVEVRVPFLDRQLTDFAWSIPEKWRMKGTTTKYLLRKAMENYLPYDVIYRPKAGFAGPIRQYLKGDWKVLVENYLFYPRKNPLFDEKALRTYWDQHQKQNLDAAYPILSILMLQFWWDAHQ